MNSKKLDETLDVLSKCYTTRYSCGQIVHTGYGADISVGVDQSEMFSVHIKPFKDHVCYVHIDDLDEPVDAVRRVITWMLDVVDSHIDAYTKENDIPTPDHPERRSRLDQDGVKRARYKRMLLIRSSIALGMKRLDKLTADGLPWAVVQCQESRDADAGEVLSRHRTEAEAIAWMDQEGCRGAEVEYMPGDAE